MRIWISGLLAAGLLASAGAASAEPVGGSAFFRLFSAVCAPHPTDWQAQSAEAGKLGFKLVDIPGRKSKDPSFAGDFDGGRFVLVIGGGPSSGDGPPTTVSRCQVYSAEPELDGIAELKTWIGLQPSHRLETGALVYFYRDGPAGKTLFKPGDRDFQAKINAAEAVGEMRIMMIYEVDSGAIITYSGARPQ